MPNTPRGITYPTSSEHTRLWDHLEAVATSADAAIGDAVAEVHERIQTGLVSIKITNLGVAGHLTVAVTFPQPFATTPNYANAQKRAILSGAGTVVVSGVQGVTATGMSIVLTNLGNASATTADPVPLQWVAVGTV